MIDKLSTRNRSRWGFDGRNTQLCSPPVCAAAAAVVNAARCQAGTPTVPKTIVSIRIFNERRGKVGKFFTKRYCAKATLCGILRYKPPVISQAYKTQVWFLSLVSWIILLGEMRVEDQLLPAEEDLSPNPRHMHLSGCSVFKKKKKGSYKPYNTRITHLSPGILPAFGQQKWHSWSSYTGERCPQLLLSPIQRITYVLSIRKKELVYNSTTGQVGLTSILDFVSFPT